MVAYNPDNESDVAVIERDTSPEAREMEPGQAEIFSEAEEAERQFQADLERIIREGEGHADHPDIAAVQAEVIREAERAAAETEKVAQQDSVIAEQLNTRLQENAAKTHELHEAARKEKVMPEKVLRWEKAIASLQRDRKQIAREFSVHTQDETRWSTGDEKKDKALRTEQRRIDVELERIHKEQETYSEQELPREISRLREEIRAMDEGRAVLGYNRRTETGKRETKDDRVREKEDELRKLEQVQYYFKNGSLPSEKKAQQAPAEKGETSPLRYTASEVKAAVDAVYADPASVEAQANLSLLVAGMQSEMTLAKQRGDKETLAIYRTFLEGIDAAKERVKEMVKQKKGVAESAQSLVSASVAQEPQATVVETPPAVIAVSPTEKPVRPATVKVEKKNIARARTAKRNPETRAKSSIPEPTLPTEKDEFVTLEDAWTGEEPKLEGVEEWEKELDYNRDDVKFAISVLENDPSPAAFKTLLDMRSYFSAQEFAARRNKTKADWIYKTFYQAIESAIDAYLASLRAKHEKKGASSSAELHNVPLTLDEALGMSDEKETKSPHMREGSRVVEEFSLEERAEILEGEVRALVEQFEKNEQYDVENPNDISAIQHARETLSARYGEDVYYEPKLDKIVQSEKPKGFFQWMRSSGEEYDNARKAILNEMQQWRAYQEKKKELQQQVRSVLKGAQILQREWAQHNRHTRAPHLQEILDLAARAGVSARIEARGRVGTAKRAAA